MGKTRWERGAQALLETLTAAEGLGSSAIRPLKEVREKRGELQERETSKRERDEGGNSRRHGKLPDERSESYEIWPPCGEAFACVPRCWYGWRSARKGTSSEGSKKDRKWRRREKGKRGKRFILFQN